ncbi:ribosomal protein L14p/L23e-domain-containing protein [Mycena galopus ATCC 62051]|nr:ribosomal protein L14p/L23e-domain-containing protein [Mycena galopus ATCC 62051]
MVAKALKLEIGFRFARLPKPKSSHAGGNSKYWGSRSPAPGPNAVLATLLGRPEIRDNSSSTTTERWHRHDGPPNGNRQRNDEETMKIPSLRNSIRTTVCLGLARPSSSVSLNASTIIRMCCGVNVKLARTYIVSPVPQLAIKRGSSASRGPPLSSGTVLVRGAEDDWPQGHCVNVLKQKVNNGWGSVGNEIGVIVQRTPPVSTAASASITAAKVRCGDVRRVIVCTCKPVRRPDGRLIRFNDNVAVLLNNKREMLGTRIGGAVSADLSGFEDEGLGEDCEFGAQDRPTLVGACSEIR